MSKTVQLPVLAKHFNDADFDDPCSCSISLAAREHFPGCNAFEYIHSVDIWFDMNGTRYKHESYGPHHFLSDLNKAQACDFDNTLIRTITLTPC